MPATSGLGSMLPTTTRRMPAARMASVQGGWRPVWQQGSKVTYSTAPAGSSRQSARAARSAWSPPHRSCHPRPMTHPSFTSTGPTSGLGLTQPTPRSASSTASAI